MGLSINRGPEWKDDSLGYINTDVSILDLCHDELNEILESLPYISIHDRDKNGGT